MLTAKLATTIDSAKTPRGAAITAVLTQPVFSADHHLILPEGTLLTGEVTLWIGEEMYVLRPGESVLAPKTVPHTYRAGDGGVRMLVASVPASFEAFVRTAAIDPDGCSATSESPKRFAPLRSPP